jgi:ABC-type transporter Mla MlaB component
MLNCEHKKVNKNHVLTMSGSLTIEHAAQVKDTIIKTLKNSASLELELGGITEIDLAGLQLLCATHRSMLSSHKNIRLITQLPTSIRKMAQQVGFLRATGCALDDNNDCLWIKGEKS